MFHFRFQHKYMVRTPEIQLKRTESSALVRLYFYSFFFYSGLKQKSQKLNTQQVVLKKLLNIFFSKTWFVCSIWVSQNLCSIKQLVCCYETWLLCKTFLHNYPFSTFICASDRRLFRSQCFFFSQISHLKLELLLR